MVFKDWQQNLVTLGKVVFAPSMGHGIDGRRGARGKDDFLKMGGVDHSPNLPSRLFILRRRLFAKPVDSTMDVGIGLSITIAHCIDDGIWPLSRRRIVQVNQCSITIDALLQDGEILPQAFRRENPSLERLVGRSGGQIQIHLAITLDQRH